jgi:hypothetical protein
LEEKNKNKKRYQMYGLGLNGPTCLELDKKKKEALPRILGLYFFSVSSTPIFFKKIRQITRHLSAQISVTIMVVGK